MVRLIEVNESFFVVDGHHHISVARALGETVLDAEVTMMNDINYINTATS